MHIPSKLVPSLINLTAAVVFFAGIPHSSALNETITSRTTVMEKTNVSYLDVSAATNTNDPGGVCNGLAKRVVINTIPAGGQVNSIVTKVRTAFNGPAIEQIGVIAVRAEQNGTQLSQGDIAAPATDLTDTTYIENSDIHSDEIGFYDEDQAWQIAAYVCGRDPQTSDPIDISGLTAGSVDFYAQKTR